MKPDEVVSLLNKIDIPVSVPTLARYVRDGLISEPERGGHGRGGGRWTEYSLYEVVEAATVWKLLNGKIEIPGEARQTIRFSPGLVRLVRQDALIEFGEIINGTIGERFINPDFIIKEGVESVAASFKKDLEEMRVTLLEDTEKLESELLKALEGDPSTKFSHYPSWFPCVEWLNSRFGITNNLVQMLQCAYVYEYGESILSLCPKLDSEN